MTHRSIKTTTITDYFLSVVMIVQNSEQTIKSTLTNLNSLIASRYGSYEIVLIDNGSQDKTIEKLIPLLHKIPCVRLIRLSRPYDHETAIYAGLDTSIGDGVIVVNPDTDPINIIPNFILKLKLDNDIVYGIADKRQHTSFSQIGNKLFYWYVRKYLHIEVSAESTGMIAMNRRVINAITRIKSQYRNLKLVTHQVGFKHTEVRYKPLANRESDQHRSLISSINRGLDIIVTYSRHPLRVVTWLGFTAGLLNLLYVGYILGIYFSRDQVAEGWTTLSLQTASMFLFVFVILIMLAEYIGRILEESRSQPIYHIMEEITSNALIPNEKRRNVVH